MNITCPLVYSYRVYKTIDASVDQIAIERINSSYVDVYVWSPRSKSVMYESYSTYKFAKKLNNKRFKYIGDTTTGRLIYIFAISFNDFSLNLIVIELVQLIADWFKVKKKKFSLYYCKRNCSSRVILLLQPCM